ncbi:cytochrome oxidase subunit III [Hymenobacter lutimineralis]|uniref:Cytochrome oxidase subunit III n=1 Tax=Hymenobacter lutimineralis TaxID=2606448 RepID=A0A5D6UYN7_9BACT|nr:MULTISPECIES: cytochrome c oxidase subunit 3 [Hymenobacter]QIX60674.1 cytochrome oxidase subunit III [Hymenobacter sp. BT18]TYZ08683.1 cytochrome oxidase subunit III [Hymenobacter lutimineralis]
MHPAETLTDKEPGTGLHPARLVLWLMIISIFMIFAAYTSAYIVRREEGNWLEFELPASMLINTVLIVLSSATVQWAYFAARKDELNQVKLGLVLTLVLGTAFLVGQWQVWAELVRNKIHFGGVDANPSGSFLYVLMGVHAFHLITGLIFLLKVLRKSFNYQVHSRQMLSIGNVTIYWHFLGGLWLYLYLFLLLNH